MRKRRHMAGGQRARRHAATSSEHSRITHSTLPHVMNWVMAQLMNSSIRNATSGQAEAPQPAMQEKLNRMHLLAEELGKLKQAKSLRDAYRRRRSEIRALKTSLRRDWKVWAQVCGQVLEPGPATA